MAETERMDSQLALEPLISPFTTDIAVTVDPKISQASSPDHLPTPAVDDGNVALDDADIMESPEILEDDAEEVIGVSMGLAQTHMKSCQTPAAEKAVVMEGADEYFDEKIDEDADEVRGDTEESPDRVTAESSLGEAQNRNAQEPASIAPESQPPLTQARESKAPPRSNASRSALRDAVYAPRPRASSGSLVIPDLANLKRFFPNISSLALPKSPSFPNFAFGDKPRDEGGDNASPRKRSSTMFSRSALSWATSIRSLSPGKSGSSPRRRLPPHFGPSTTQDNGPVDQKNTMQNDAIDTAQVPRQVDGALLSNVSSEESLRPRPLRRATSDNSLYLRRSLSKSSTLDDFARWDNIQDQVNSRFKAITDSFQDSSIKLPSVPKFLRPDFSLHRSNSEIAQRNTVLNSQISTLVQTEGQRAIASSSTQGGAVKVKSNHPILKDVMSKMTGDIVLMGGYRGSILRSAKPPHQQLWVPIKVGLNLRKVDLEVGLEPEDEENMEEMIIPDGMLSHIGPVDISRRLLKKLRKSEHCRAGRLRVHDYGYDWRLSPHLLSRRLMKFLESLDCNAPGTPPEKRGAMVVAHSLGGLITRHAVNQRPDLFAGVVYAGVPQHCVNILGPLRNGDDVLISSRVLTAQVNFTLRTSFVLLPEDGRCFIDRETKEEYPVNFFDPDAWDEYRFSPCIAPPFRSSHHDHRKSLIDAMSSNLTSLPIPHKHSSMALLQEDQRGRSNSGPSTARTTAQNAEQNVADLAHTAAHPDQTIAPQLSPSHSPTRYNPVASNSISTTCTIPHDKAVEYLKRTLAETLKFKQELAFDPSHHDKNLYPPASVLYTKSVPTVYGARVSSREAIKTVDAYDDLAFAAGDGVCLARAAMLPKGYMLVKGGLLESERGHVSLLGDLEGVGRCLRALIEAREKGCGMGFRNEESGNKSPVWDGLKNVFFGEK
jgi:pimeloyl-ACP methyl ester carboxylesterase